MESKIDCMAQAETQTLLNRSFLLESKDRCQEEVAEETEEVKAIED